MPLVTDDDAIALLRQASGSPVPSTTTGTRKANLLLGHVVGAVSVRFIALE
jgi:hypothetical protein